MWGGQKRSWSSHLSSLYSTVMVGHVINKRQDVAVVCFLPLTCILHPHLSPQKTMTIPFS